jgi:PPOX class probable F420-dependent enzyme
VDGASRRRTAPAPVLIPKTSNRVEKKMIENAQVDPYAMSQSEMTAFLAERRYAAVSTLRRDGSPITIFVGFEWDGDYFYFNVRNSRLIKRRLEHDPRVSIAITNEYYPSKFVTADGDVEIIVDADWVRTRRMFLRYLSPDDQFQRQKDIDVEGFWAAYFEVGRTMYRVKPRRLASEDGAKWELGAAATSDERARSLGLLPTD